MEHDPLYIVTKAVTERDRRYIAKALSLIEEGLYEEFSDILFSEYRSHIVGITGSPGVGKSTLINALIAEIRKRGKSVAVIAIDPSSPISGGAFLGNRVRIRALDENSFYRSISTPPEKSLPLHAYLMLELLNRVGYDYILIETPGAGQVNVDIVRIADTVVVVVQPFTGDDIQILKAGIMEIGDIYVVNKADLPQADIVELHLKSLLQDYDRDGWSIRVLKVSALRGKGISELLDAIDEHRRFLEKSSKLQDKVFVRRLSIVREYLMNIISLWVSKVLEKPSSTLPTEELYANPIRYAKKLMEELIAFICKS